MIDKRRKPKKDRSLFRRGLAIWAAVLTVTGIAILAVLWQFMAAYERSITERALEALVASPESLRFAAATGDAELDDYLFALKLEGRELTYLKKSGEYSAAKPVYSLLAGGSEYFTVTLAESGDAGFGMSRWKVDTVTAEPLYYATELHTLRVTAPAGAEVYVNGKLLDGTALEKQNAAYGTLNPYESGVEGLFCDVYSADGLFEIPEVKATLDGSALNGVSSDGYTYVFLPGEQRSLKISAPVGAVVTVNDYILSEDYIVSYNEYADVGEYERGSDKLPREAVYVLDGMLGEPAVAAHMEGNLLTPMQSGDNYSFAYPRELMYSLELTLPDGASAVVSGKPLADSARTLSGHPYDELSGLSGVLGNIPSYSVYRLDGLYLEPEVTASDAAGALTLISNSGEGRARKLEFARVSEGEHDTETLLALMRSYVEYTAYGSSETKAHYDAMLPYMMDGSPVLSRMSDSIESIKWNSVMTGITYNLVETTNFVDYSESCYACELHCDVTLTRWGSERHYDSRWRVVCVKNGDGWLVWEMKSAE